MAALEQEQLRVVLLDTRNKIKRVVLVYQGTANCTHVRLAECFREAVRAGARAIVVVEEPAAAAAVARVRDIRAAVAEPLAVARVALLPTRMAPFLVEATALVRAAGLRLTATAHAGTGIGTLLLAAGGEEAPLPLDDAGTDMVGAAERLAHIEELRPEICTLDCGTMNFAAGGDYVMVNTPSMLRAMAGRIQELGVRPELEVFDTGNLVMVKHLMREGLIDAPPLIQLCMGIPYGAPDDPLTLLSMVEQLPAGAVFSAFSIGRMQLPYVAMAALAGGNVRVGLEDNLYLSRGVLATNAQLVERAVTILEAMNARVLGPDEVREKLRLVRRG
jgi:uncharacterized protein (DUF849 family)